MHHALCKMMLLTSSVDVGRKPPVPETQKLPKKRQILHLLANHAPKRALNQKTRFEALLQQYWPKKASILLVLEGGTLLIFLIFGPF